MGAGRAHELKCCGDTFWMYIVVVIGLLLFSGLMSGLTLGLMSLGAVDLEVIKKSGKPADRKNAEKIMSLVKRRHLLLVTLLVGNAMAMEALPLFLDSLVGTWIAIVLSVTLLLMFGEILPQAVCSRYGLAIGAVMAPFVRVLLFLLFPIAWPVSKLLDKLLGTTRDGLFGRAQLKTLVDMHGNEAGGGGELSRHETRIIAGALELVDKTAGYAMNPIDTVFSVDVQALTKLDNKTMMCIFASGYSRIPVYSSHPKNIIGLILVKNFLSVTFEKWTKVPIIEVPIRNIPRVSEDMPLYEVLEIFQQSHSRMAAVERSRFPKKESEKPDIILDVETGMMQGALNNFKADKNRDPWKDGEAGDVIGIITREDVLDELLKEKILDGATCKVLESIGDREFEKLPSGMESPVSNASFPPIRHYLSRPVSQRPPKHPTTEDVWIPAFTGTQTSPPSDECASTEDPPPASSEPDTSPESSCGSLKSARSGVPDLRSSSTTSLSVPSSPGFAIHGFRTDRRTQSMDDIILY